MQNHNKRMSKLNIKNAKLQLFAFWMCDSMLKNNIINKIVSENDLKQISLRIPPPFLVYLEKGFNGKYQIIKNELYEIMQAHIYKALAATWEVVRIQVVCSRIPASTSPKKYGRMIGNNPIQQI